MSEQPVPRARPMGWNDDVRWLLERIGGILHDQGRGTGIDTLTRGSPRSPVVHYVRGDHVDVGTSEVTTIQLPTTTRSWKLTAVQYNPTGGSAANYQLRIGQDSAFVDDGPDERIVFTSAAVGVITNDAFCAGIMLRADSDGRVYLKPGFDSGSDNDGVYQLWFEEYVETTESTA